MRDALNETIGWGFWGNVRGRELKWIGMEWI